MSNYSTVKVSKTTLRKLHKLSGELTTLNGKRISLDETLIYLLKKEKELKNLFSSSKSTDIDNDRKNLLSLLEKEYFGAGPEDYKEYDFNDI